MKTNMAEENVTHSHRSVNASNVEIILAKLADIDKQQSIVGLCVGDIMKRLDSLKVSGAKDNDKRLEIKADGQTVEEEENRELKYASMLKSLADLEQRQTQVLLLIESMNRTVVHENQELINQIKRLDKKQEEVHQSIANINQNFWRLRTSIFGISFLVIGTSGFVVFIAFMIARKINNINSFYRRSISRIVTDILKANKPSVNSAEIVGRLRDILITPTAKIKDTVNFS